MKKIRYLIAILIFLIILFTPFSSASENTVENQQDIINTIDNSK